MATFIVAGHAISLLAIRVDQKPTSQADAWAKKEYVTVQLMGPVVGIRVHTGGRAFPNRPASGAQGAWVSIGDTILTSTEVVDRSALPGPFTHAAEATIRQGTIINVGVNGAVLAGKGGGIQAEYVSGPPIQFTQLTGKVWMSGAGHA